MKKIFLFVAKTELLTLFSHYSISFMTNLIQFCLLVENTEEWAQKNFDPSCIKLAQTISADPDHGPCSYILCQPPSTIQDHGLLQNTLKGVAVQHYGLTAYFGELPCYSLSEPNLLDFISDDIDFGSFETGKSKWLVGLHVSIIICMTLFVLDIIFDLKMVKNNSIKT